MVSGTILHYEILDKLGEARLHIRFGARGGGSVRRSPTKRERDLK